MWNNKQLILYITIGIHQHIHVYVWKMCLSPTCDCLDDCCCPFPEKAKFFGYWTFGSGIYVMWFQYILLQSKLKIKKNTIHSYYFIKGASDTLNVPQIAFQAVLDCIQMAAGICILIGVYRVSTLQNLSDLLVLYFSYIFCARKYHVFI